MSSRRDTCFLLCCSSNGAQPQALYTTYSAVHMPSNPPVASLCASDPVKKICALWPGVQIAHWP